MYLVHGIVAACSILLLAPIARADCIIAPATSDPEVNNGVWVLQQMTQPDDLDVKRIDASKTNEEERVADIAAAANSCKGKVYFVGHSSDFSVAEVNKAIADIDLIKEAAVYKCKCTGGGMTGGNKIGKVTFCLDKIFWPAHIKTAIGFLIKPDQWTATNYRQTDPDLAKAGDDLLVRMTLVHDCQGVFKQQNEAAHKLYSELDLRYRQDKTNQENKGAMQRAFDDWKIKEKRYDDCKDFKSPETVIVLTRPGPLIPANITKVMYDGTVTPPQQ